MTQSQWQMIETMVGGMTPDDRQRLVSMLGEVCAPPVAADRKAADDPIIGCFAHESELLDKVMESVYLARETHPLRTPE